MNTSSPSNLTGVPETMLWSLHNRASEALLADPLLVDPEALRIYRSIDYDYRRSFGPPDGSHALRSRLFDDALRPWMDAHPGGRVVELGCGLETQFQRIDDGKVRWFCVDLPEAIDVRQRLLPELPRCRYIRSDVLDLRWIDAIDGDGPVVVTAQGLFMYLHEPQVATMFAAICERLPDVTVLFDAIPRWFSRRTLSGLRLTPHYVAPPMPWGADCHEIEATLRRWSARVDTVGLVRWGRSRGVAGAIMPILMRMPVLRDRLPCFVAVRTRSRAETMP